MRQRPGPRVGRVVSRLPTLGAGCGDALELVAALVVADLADDVGHGHRVRPPLGELAGEGPLLELGMGGDETHVLVLGVVLEGSVEGVAPRRLDEVEQPGGELPRRGGAAGAAPVKAETRQPMAAPGDEVLEHQHVPLLVVVLDAGLGNPHLDAAGES